MLPSEHLLEIRERWIIRLSADESSDRALFLYAEGDIQALVAEVDRLSDALFVLQMRDQLHSSKALDRLIAENERLAKALALATDEPLHEADSHKPWYVDQCKGLACSAGVDDWESKNQLGHCNSCWRDYLKGVPG